MVFDEFDENVIVFLELIISDFWLYTLVSWQFLRAVLKHCKQVVSCVKGAHFSMLLKRVLLN